MKCISCRQGFIWECVDECSGLDATGNGYASDSGVVLSGSEADSENTEPEHSTDQGERGTEEGESDGRRVSVSVTSSIVTNSDGLAGFDSDIDETIGFDQEESGRKVNAHNDHNLRDQQSTGRKRAAVEYPLNREAACEWKMKSNVGGGPSPIVGCLNGLQQARHHGPDKNTLNNDLGNVHRICHVCHNRWHTANDEIYVWGIIQNEHAPVEATLADIGNNEMYWAGRQLVKADH